MRELRRRCPDAEARTLHLDWNDVHPALLDHRVDVVIAREPFPSGQLRVAVGPRPCACQQHNPWAQHAQA
ncbi:hypothetical protein [Streptomyces sp. NPDC056661]|uniref:hypothetical protein n=1 Tax=Streptomyces sp. NPDC056661 TaxID=3345898 RepID=UPI0036C2CEB0